MENDRVQNVLEQAEDAYFSVLLGAYTEAQSQHLLEESKRLNDAPDYELPETLDRKCLALIHRAEQQNRRKRIHRGLKRAVNTASILIAVLALSGALLFVTVDAFRAGVVNYLLETYVRDEGTTIRASGTEAYQSEMAWKPVGYHLEKENHMEATSRYVFVSAQGARFTLLRTALNTTITLDTEGAETGELELPGRQAFYAVKGGRSSLTWITPEEGCIYFLESEDLELPELAALAESMEEAS